MACIAVFSVRSCHGGFYAGALGGVNFIDVVDHVIAIDPETGYVIGGFGGYGFCCGMRLEAEVAYRRNSVKGLRLRGDSMVKGTGHADLTTVMVNALYEIPTCYDWLNPYLGLGLGYCHANHNVEAGFLGTLSGGEDNFSWQAIVGFGYPLTDCFDVGIEYRYLRPMQLVDDHAAVLSLKRIF